MYKGYKVQEIILHDYAIAPQTAVVVNVSCGCSQCQHEGRVLPGHSLCGLLPEDLVDDLNISPFLDSTHGWLAEFIGDNSCVDKWLS